MKLITMVVACGLLASAAAAQTKPPATSANPAVTAPATNDGAGGASGDSNQAVATTTANAAQPAKGANSFTEGEARRRIEKEGYATVADLKKDGDGVWRGHGSKNGANVSVWLDYKGNVGNQ
jgi:protein CpxP